MDLHLKGSRIIVTGATRGIGLAIANTFAAEGADVAVCSRDASTANKLAASLVERGAGRSLGAAIDVSDGAALKQWVIDVGTQWGGLDVVVSNVSALAISDDLSSWHKSFETDILGTVNLVSAAIPLLEKSKEASIVAISSVSVREIDFASGPYGSLKAALIHYVQGLAQQLAAKGIRANTVSPGNVYFEGGVWNDIERDDPTLYAKALALNPTGRMGTPQEIANAVAFISSPAASFISGANLVVDGALTRGVQL